MTRPITDGTIRCPRCRQEKPLGAFGVRTGTNRRRAYCHACENDHTLMRRREKQEQLRAAAHRWWMADLTQVPLRMLNRKFGAVLDQVRRSDAPLVITAHGRPALVAVPYTQYRALKEDAGA